MFVAGPAMPVSEPTIDALDPALLVRAPEVAAHRLGRPAVAEEDCSQENVERQDDAIALL